MEWSFVHKTSSPWYPKENAHAERAVGVIKEIYTKCGDNFLLGLLVHRTVDWHQICLLYITVIQNWLLNNNLQMTHPEPGM